jgi:hypothetical protein
MNNVAVELRMFVLTNCCNPEFLAVYPLAIRAPFSIKFSFGNDGDFSFMFTAVGNFMPWRQSTSFSLSDSVGRHLT